MAWAALLAVIAGYVDAISYLLLGNAFAANMTGNLVEIGINLAGGEWRRALWLSSLLLAFLLGSVTARLLFETHRAPRFSLLLDAAAIALGGTGWLGAAAVPLLSAAMAIQNEAVTHGIVAANVAFITGDIQRLGESLAGVFARRRPARQGAGQGRVILLILVCYALGAGLGTLASQWGPAVLYAAAGLLAAAVAVPPRWSGLAAAPR